MIWPWIFACTFSALLLELLLCTLGLPTPVLAVAAFYFTVINGWRLTVVPFAIACAMLDITQTRTFPASVLLLPGVLALALFWRQHGDCQHQVAQAVPGSLVGVLWGAGLVLLQSAAAENWSLALALHNVWFILSMTITGAFALPLVHRYLDHTAGRLGLPRYSGTREDRHHAS